MGWASDYIKELQSGKIVEFRPVGGSMKPHIESGQLVTVAPIYRDIRVLDIVLCVVKGSQYLHFVKDTKIYGDTNWYQIGNAHGRINGWITKDDIFGIYESQGFDPKTISRPDNR